MEQTDIQEQAHVRFLQNRWNRGGQAYLQVFGLLLEQLIWQIFIYRNHLALFPAKLIDQIREHIGHGIPLHCKYLIEGILDYQIELLIYYPCHVRVAINC